MAERKLTIRMQAETAHLKKGMATASASTRGFGKSIEQGITRHAAGIRMTGMAIAGIGAAMTAMAVVSIKAAAGLETSLANVSTMLDKTAMDIMPEYERGLREMSKEFGEATETLSKGLYDILSASIDSSKALDVLEVSAKLAAAGLTDTGVAADAITTIINSYAMAAEDAGKISDWMFSVVKRGKLTMAELAPSVGKVAATASIAGVSLEELGASIATITRAGIRSQEAMTAINGILRAFLKPTDDAAKAAKEFGFELNTNTLRTIGFRGVLELLSEATAEQTAAMFPNIRGLKGVAAAMKDTTGFTKDYELMLNSAGMTEEAFVKQTGTLNFALGQLKQEFADILVSLGKELIPIIKRDFIPLLKNLGDKLKTVTGWFAGLPSPVKKFLLVLGPLLIALGGLIAMLPTLITMLPFLGAAFHFALGPIGLVTLAISGLVAAFTYFYTTSEKFRNVVKTIAAFLEFLGRIFWAGLDVIIGNIAGFLGWLSVEFPAVFKTLGNFFATFFLNLGKNVAELMKWLVTKLDPRNWFKKIPKPDWTPLLEGFESTIASVPKLIGLNLDKAEEILYNRLLAIEGVVADTKLEIPPIEPPIIPPITLPDIEPIKKALKEVREGVVELSSAEDHRWRLVKYIHDKEKKQLGEREKALDEIRKGVVGVTSAENHRWRVVKAINDKEKKQLEERERVLDEIRKNVVKVTSAEDHRWKMVKAIHDKELKQAKEREKALDEIRKGVVKLSGAEDHRWKLVKAIHDKEKEQEKERIALLDSLTREEKEYYRKISGYLVDYTDMSKGELEEVKNAWGRAGEDISTGWTAYMISMEEATINWVEVFRRLGGEVTEIFKSSISSWIREGQTFGEFWNGLVQRLADTWLNIFIENLMKTEPIKMVLDSVTWLMGNLTKAIMGAASAAWEFAGPAIMKLISGLGSLIGKLWDAVAATMKFVYATLKAIAVAVYNAVAWIPFIGPVLGIIAAAAAIAAILALVGSIIFPAQKGLYAREPMTVRVAEEGVPEIISPEPIMRKIVREESQIGVGEARYPAGVTVNVPRGAIVIYGDIRTKMDVEELEETLGQKFGEEIARRVEEV